jgi:hypothetical protein
MDQNPHFRPHHFRQKSIQMDHATEKGAEHAEDSIALTFSPPPSTPSPSHQRERDLSKIQHESGLKKLLQEWASNDYQKLMGEFGSAEANRPKWNQRTQMADLKDGDIPGAINGIGGSKLHKAENGRRKNHRGGKRVKKKHARKASGWLESGDDVETTFEEPVVDEWGNKNSEVEMVGGYEDSKKKDKKKKRKEKRGDEEILESNQHEPAALASEAIDRTAFSPKGKIQTKKKREKNEKPMSCQEMQDAGNSKKGQRPRTVEKKDATRAARLERKVAAAVAPFGTDEELLAAKLAHKQHLSNMERKSGREADEAVVETSKKKRKMNHDSSAESPDQSGAMSVYSSNPNKRRDRKSTVTDPLGNEGEAYKQAPLF